MGKHRKISIGDKFYYLEVLENLGYRKCYGKNMTIWKCRCTRCGNVVEVPQARLCKTKDCGCGRKLPHKEIASGTKFGRLTVLEIGDRIKDRGYTYLCECSCDKHTRLYVKGTNLRSGETTSCGCVHDELFQENVKKAYKRNFVNNTSFGKIMSDTVQSNNTSGVRGVSWHKKSKKWRVRIDYKKHAYFLGYYSDINDAKRVVDTARAAIKKDFADWYSKNYPEYHDKLNKKMEASKNEN
jgi:hypothetical protein